MRLSPKHLKSVFTVAAAGVLGLTASSCLAQPPANDGVLPQNVQAIQLDQKTNDDLLMILSTLMAAKQLSVTDVDQEKMMQGAIDGMLKTLSPHDAYISAEELEDMNTMSTGQYAGVGMEMETKDGVIRITAPMDGSPAERAGVKPGDIIIAVDGTSMIDATTNDAVKLIKGAPGTQVEITFAREGEKDPIVLKMTREIITVPAVTAKLIGDVGYIRLPTFMNDHGDSEMRNAVAALQRQAGGADKIKGYVLDLRNNPGGLITQAQGVADNFLDSTNDIVTQRRRDGTVDESMQATKGDILNGAKLVVLINGGSASASELVAGALQDYGRATIIGTPSYGKGSVQQVIPMHHFLPGRKDAIKITTHLYHTPRGWTPQNRGVLPNIAVEGAGDGMEIRETDLKQTIRIKNGDSKDPINQTTKSCTANQNLNVATLDKALVARDGKADSALLCAVDALRGSSQHSQTKPVTPKAPAPSFGS